MGDMLTEIVKSATDRDAHDFARERKSLESAKESSEDKVPLPPPADAPEDELQDDVADDEVGGAG